MEKKTLEKILFLLPIFLLDCSYMELKYSDDNQFLGSAAANASEFPMSINNIICRDMEGKIGVCSKQIKRNEALQITNSARPYAYQFFLTCSPELKNDFNVSVLPNVPFKFTLTPDKYGTLKSFICIGRAVPLDRSELSAQWDLRVKVISEDYIAREDIYLYKNYLVLGTYAKYGRVYHDGHWWRYQNKPVIKVKNTNDIKAMSESFNMRFNYYNY